MKKIFLLLAFALFLKSRLCAQYSPAIKEMLKEVKEASFYDSTKVFSTGQETIAKATNTNDKGAVAEVYLYYGNYFYYTRNIKQAKIYLERAIITAKATHNKHIETLANIRLMFMEYESGLGEGVEKDFLALLEETKRTKDYENTVELLNLLGIINEEKNQLKEAARLYLEGLVFSESHNIAHYPAVFRNNLGLIKLYTDQTDDALRDFEKGLELTKKENDINLASHIKINMCLIYVSKNKINDALKIFSEVITYARTNNHPRELSSAFINLGSAFNNTNRHDMALSYIDSAINVLKDYRLHVELTKAYLEKADVLINLKNFSEARKTLALANDMSHKTGNLDDRATYLLFSHRLEKAEKHYEAALNNYLAYRSLKDSMEQTVNGKIIQELQLKYNVQKKEIELEKEKSKYLLLEKTNQDERFIKWLTIGIAIIVLILVISAVYYLYSLKLREKQESFSRQLIENIEEDRLRISMDLHDDIGQSLSIIKSKLTVSKNLQDDKSLETELARVIEQTREISRNLYPSYLEKIGLVRSIARLSENVQSSANIECSFDVSDKVEKLNIAAKTHIYRILQECTNNTIKHSKASALKIEITEHNGEYVLQYQDNGIGLNGKQKSGLGLLSIKERAKIINGQVNIEDKLNKSFKLTLKFKP